MPQESTRLRRRHSGVTRICHWINLICFLFLLPSGLQVFNAYPRLHVGISGGDGDPALAEIVAIDGPDGPQGVTRIGPLSFTTTGLLGVSQSAGRTQLQAFPSWSTLPERRNLAEGRRWHFFFAWIFAINGAVYLLAHLFSGHFRRDILPKPRELRPSHLMHDIRQHLRGRFSAPEGGYNVLQKLSYVVVIFVLLPGMVLTGLTMSPGLNAGFSFLLDLFGGRPTARTIHFICAIGLVAFIVIHVLMVLLSGPIRQMRGMITGGPKEEVRK